MAPIPPLPLDLLRPILSHITDKGSLLQLCYVSKTFLLEARLRLFTDVSLESATVAAFCHTLLAMSPTQAVNVKRLSIQLANEFTALGDLARTLRALPNLRALEITPPQPQAWADVLVRTRDGMLGAWKHTAAAHILHGCPFRLREFGSAFRVAEPAFLTFLREQPEIEELWSFDTAGDVVTLQVQMLPRLEKFRSTAPRLQFETAPEKGASQRMVHMERMDAIIQLGSEDVFHEVSDEHMTE
ncbi:hypothetical protein K438DRAFT_1989315 [Mycena galopus ATCC 62051]|nr:hypothetical protein K438DRAFT_1989315 [Mycena galopus ATCC 62051]